MHTLVQHMVAHTHVRLTKLILLPSFSWPRFAALVARLRRTALDVLSRLEVFAVLVAFGGADHCGMTTTTVMAANTSNYHGMHVETVIVSMVGT